MESTQLHPHPQSHGIHNAKKKKKKKPKSTTTHKHSPPPPPPATGKTRHHQQQTIGCHHQPILLKKITKINTKLTIKNEEMNQLHLYYNPNHMKSTQLHHYPKSHGIHNLKKKLTCDLYQSTSSMRSNSTVTADLNGNGLGEEKKKKERERERDSDKEAQRK